MINPSKLTLKANLLKQQLQKKAKVNETQATSIRPSRCAVGKNCATFKRSNWSKLWTKMTIFETAETIMEQIR